MPKSITKLLVSFGTAICFTGFLGITTTRSQPVDPSCSNLSPSPLSKTDSSLTIEKAREDASKAEPCERSTNLIPIKDNPRLRLYLRMKNGKEQVLMVTLKGRCDPDSKKPNLDKPNPDKPNPDKPNPNISCYKQGQSYTVPQEPKKDPKDPKGGLWVTAVPEVKKFVRDYLSKSQDKETSSSFLSSRVEQYLGLPPNGGYKYFVEVWVNKDDLTRPCSNSTVDNTTCDVPIPGSFYDPRSNTKYPFTGLGYTYDWGNPNTDIGASEFIVKVGATVTIFGKKTTDEYLQGLTPHLQQK